MQQLHPPVQLHSTRERNSSNIKPVSFCVDVTNIQLHSTGRGADRRNDHICPGAVRFKAANLPPPFYNGLALPANSLKVNAICAKVYVTSAGALC